MTIATRRNAAGRDAAALALASFAALLAGGPVSLPPGGGPQESGAARGRASPGSHPTFLVHDALIVDGTGAPAYRGSVRIHGDRISSLGDLTPRRGERVVEAGGHVLAPGFIDTGEAAGELPADPLAEAAVSRGVTTVVVGTRGRHRFPLARWFDSLRAAPPTVNVASFAGLETLRHVASSRAPEPRSVEQEAALLNPLLRRELEAGALGLSLATSGTTSDSPTADLVRTLAPLLEAFRGTVVSHPAGDASRPGGWDALPEAIRGRVLDPDRAPGPPSALEEVVHRLTGRAAAAVGIRGSSGGPRPGRGVIERLAYADLVLFDPETIAAPRGDGETRFPGILRVWVSGREVWANGAPTGATPGRIIRWPRM